MLSKFLSERRAVPENLEDTPPAESPSAAAAPAPIDPPPPSGLAVSFLEAGQESAGGPEDAETRLFNAMDRFVIRMMNVLGDERIDEKTGQLAVPIQTRMQAFKQAQDWLVRRKKLEPASKDESSGIAAMREMMEDPDKFAARMKEMGFVQMPQKRPKGGRPTKAEAEQRQAARQAIAAARGEQDQGSGWSKFGIEGDGQ